jgi:mannose/cellobiose epimerase-like protein (N-acyl-D-glucosamine 2-epimerase family)
MPEHAGQNQPIAAQALGTTAERMLVADVVPFWERSVDRRWGGYCLNHDASGRWLGPSEKFLVTQARTLWFFARLAREGLVSADGADVGYRFLRDHMWDRENGGFYWAVDHEGLEPTKPGKHLYGQASALYALCEHARATGDREVHELCRVLFGLIDRRAYDEVNPGYRESFTVDWQTPPAEELGYLGTVPDRKLFNTHLHLLEALTSLEQLGHADLMARRVDELIEVCSQAVVDKATGGCRDVFLSDWSPVPGSASDRVTYGHDLENIALLHAAAGALGGSSESLLQRSREICQHALTYGRDIDQGGFFASGRLGEPADRREKIYWVQAEALVGLLRMWQVTEEPLYLECLSQTLGWIDAKQVDRVGGDWHAVIATDGVASGNKAGRWKDPYHQARALLEVSALAGDSMRSPGGRRPGTYGAVAPPGLSR